MEKIKSIREFQLLSQRTCTDLGTVNKNSLHMLLGIHTEVGEALDIYKKTLAYGKEFDIVNLGEELGDILWYFVNLCTLNHKELWEDSIFPSNRFAISEDLKGILMEDIDEVEALIRILQPEEGIEVKLGAIFHVASKKGLDMYEIMTKNVEKLKIRYPEKFTEEAALNRDLEAERKELEK